MSRRAIAWVFALLCLGSSVAKAASFSLADSFYPSYGRAVHLNQANEWLGSRSDAYDGLALPANILPDHIITVTIRTNVGALFHSGDYEYLSCWIDWNQDRVWTESERVVEYFDHWFDAGLQTVSASIDVPADALTGDTWARTRFGFDGRTSPSGTSYTGEVEDYRVRVGDTANPVPEPSSLALAAMAIAFGGLSLLARRRRGTVDGV